jgi:signal transduction histidine kinase
VADSGQTQTFLSTITASRLQRRLALAIVLLLAAAFLATAPFAAVPLLRADAFIPAYESALIVEDAITAALLFAQFAIVRVPSLLLLGTGYLFTALIVLPHMLVFPGLFTPTGLFGAGPSSAAWIYVAWHLGFPIAVIVYAFRDDERRAISPGKARRAILLCVVATVGFVIALTALATIGEPLLPQVIAADRRTASFPYITGSIWLLAAVALAILWWRRRRSILDLWLAVVLCAWLCEIALSVLLAPARFSVGFYFGRLYGVIAASIVLIVLLSETTTLYARLARAIATERRVRERRLSEMEAMLSHLSRVSDLGQVVTTLIHEVNQPLAAIGNYLAALQRLSAMGDKEKVAATIEKTLGQSERAREIMRRLREFVAKREIDRRPEPLATTVEDAIAVAQAATGRIGVEIETMLEPPAATVVIDRIQIQQVLVNLIRNASEAMVESKSPHRRLTIASRPLGPEKLEISIADTGPGLPPALRAKLFQPFVTTKATGMGVGLSICRFIIEAHGEKLQVADNAGGGTVFSFTLPLAIGAATAAQAAGD